MSTVEVPIKLPRYVWEAPVRVWHWVMALAMFTLMVTGYFIGSPPASVHGEASEHFLFGYIRFVHFSAAYIFAVAFLGRVYWAVVGNEQAREIFCVPVYLFRPSWWRGLFRTIAHYFFLREGEWHYGHNQLAMAAMFAMYVLGSVFMIFTGFALYGEGLGQQSWAFRWFSSWVIPLFGQSQDVHTWHHMGMWYLVWFTMVHLYFASREELTSGVTIIGSMVNGWRRVKDR
jgi:Ni/Fe-hydrogenase 1 B-type cytochrome subunit